jgi:MFS transporter, DHA2 family, multidrug resistance protein
VPALPQTPVSNQPIDAISLALSCLVFATIVTGMDAALTELTLAFFLFVAAVIAAAALMRRELPKATPLVPLDLLRAPSFRVSVIASVLCFCGQTAGLVALPFFLQQNLGQVPAAVGLYMMCWPLSVAVAAILVGRLAKRVSSSLLCALGGLCLAVGLFTAALASPRVGAASLVPSLILCGIGFGIFQTPNNRNMFLAAPLTRSAAAGAAQSMARLTGQTFGALLAGVMFSTLSVALAPLAALYFGAVLTLAAGSVSLLRAR